MKTNNKTNDEIGMSSTDYSEPFYGTILIPDISGFTKFVNNTDLYTGRIIIMKLLDILLTSNILQLEVSEIEGDAILFYKKGRVAPKLLEKQFNIMHKAFNNQLNILQINTGEKIELSLKLIGHYGQLSEISVGRFKKLYGKAVIEAHRLLKNSVKSDTYILLTDALLNNKTKAPLPKDCSIKKEESSETYAAFPKLKYTFFNYEQATIDKVDLARVNHPKKLSVRT